MVRFAKGEFYEYQEPRGKLQNTLQGALQQKVGASHRRVTVFFDWGRMSAFFGAEYG